MKRTIAFLIIMSLLSSFSLLAISKKKLYKQAVAATDNAVKLKLFKQYIAKYTDKEEGNTANAYYFLTKLTLSNKVYKDAITYGEEFISSPNIDDNKKMQVYLWMANAYNLAKVDEAKALEYCDATLDLGSKMIESFKNIAAIRNNITGNFIFPALRIKIKILYSKIKDDHDKCLEVVELNNRLLQIRKGDIDTFVKQVYLKCGLALGISHQDFENGIKTLELIYDQENPDNATTKLLASYYRKLGNEEKSVEYLGSLYKVKRDPKMAKQLGLLYYKSLKNKEEAVRFFAEGYVLEGENKESDMFKYMQQIWYKEMATEMTVKEKKDGFEKLIEEAKLRVSGTETVENQVVSQL
jgi:tetratricopeptide (TPR) repeat protein